MAHVLLEGISKHFGSVTVIEHLDLRIEDREFLVLVGPSGCGKSTVLRLIAGIEDLTIGTIRIGGRVVNDVAPKDRDIAMVFQSSALYPHMSVRQNLETREWRRWDIDRVSACTCSGRCCSSRRLRARCSGSRP